jgi:putative RecB family exonuclease
MSRARYPRGHTFSPSVLTSIRMCMKRHWFKKVLRLPDPPGPAARVGSLVHKVLEVVALKRLEPEAGTEPLALEVEAPELLDVLEMEHSGEGGWVIKAAREELEGCAPLDLAHTTQAEGIIERFDLGDGITLGGIVDRVDQWEDEDGHDHAVITDYKTGFIPPAEELAQGDQAILYLAWGAETFGIYDDRLVMMFHWPEEDIRISVRYDHETVTDGIAAAKRTWERWSSGGYDKANAAPATLGVSCGHCPFSDQCEEYQEHITKPARVAPWAGLGLPELVARRHQIAGDAKMFEVARKALDQHLLGRIEVACACSHDKHRGACAIEGCECERYVKVGKFDTDEYRAKVQRNSVTNYSMGVVEALANATGLELEDVMRAVCGIGKTKLTAFVNKHKAEHPRVSKVVTVYATPSQGAAHIRASAKGGLF